MFPSLPSPSPSIATAATYSLTRATDTATCASTWSRHGAHATVWCTRQRAISPMGIRGRHSNGRRLPAAQNTLRRPRTDSPAPHPHHRTTRSRCAAHGSPITGCWQAPEATRDSITPALPPDRSSLCAPLAAACRHRRSTQARERRRLHWQPRGGAQQQDRGSQRRCKKARRRAQP